MFSPEQSSNNVTEKPKITTPEEADEMTKKRRKDFGLEEKIDLSQEEKETLEKEIKKLLIELDSFDYQKYSEEIKDEWYYAELEADAGKDRELALKNLKKFIEKLKTL